MISAWSDLFASARGAFVQQRTFDRACTLAASTLACLGRHTISGLLCTAGQQFVDWSAAYRLFEQERIDETALWRVPLRAVVEELPPAAPVVALIDDTLARKCGHHIAGASWRRDPLGPPFSTNFVWAQRYLQISLALPADPAATVSAARAVPVDLLHAPSARKPGPKAPPEQWRAWKDASAAAALTQRGAERMLALRQALDQQPGGADRTLLFCADASFTNRTVLQQLPPRTTLIGRVRKDARLHALPDDPQPFNQRGRCRCYGPRLPTPEQIRQNDSIPWQTVHAFAAGAVYAFDIKVVGPLRWPNAGGSRQLQLLVVRPVGYRLRKRATMNYRQPAYLICTDALLPPEQILQPYLWRWEIELNFRDEKTLLGLGQPQVRTEPAVRLSSTFFVFNYALLLLALHRCRLLHSPLPPPSWQRPDPRRPMSRITTSQGISLFRANVWSSALGLRNKNGFLAPSPLDTNRFQIATDLQSAVLYAGG